MKENILAVLLTVAGGLAVAIPAAPAAEFDQTHALYGNVLKRFTKDNLVDYAGLKADRKDLDTYLDQVAAVPEATFQQWSRTDQLAFLINLYNAQTLGLIVDHYPLNSIREIGVFPRAPWKKKIVRLHGAITTLYDLENDLIRRKYPEYPQIHFALVCAAMGCPPMRAEPYAGARLEAQFQDQGKRFMATPHKNRVEAQEKVVYLSKIFDWYAADFGKNSAAIIKFVEPYFPEAARKDLQQGGFKIKHTDYDWALNEWRK
jgi:hypothetical protein